MRSTDISIVFPAYAGGKFISNCIGMSKKIMLNWSNTQKDLTYLLESADDYDFRLDFILSTLPDRNSLSSWLEYELSEHDKKSSFYNEAKEKKFKFCFSVHDDYKIKNNSDVVNLKKYQKFRKIAYNLKKSNRILESPWEKQRYDILKGSNWPIYKEFSDLGFDYSLLQNYNKDIKDEISQYYPIGNYKKVFHFDMNTIFNYNRFINELKKLYNYLDLKDFNEEYIKVYYKEYINLHDIEFVK